MCTELAVGKPLTMRVHPKDGKTFDVKLSHTYNEAQIEWFKNGSALNTRFFFLSVLELWKCSACSPPFLTREMLPLQGET